MYHVLASGQQHGSPPRETPPGADVSEAADPGRLVDASSHPGQHRAEPDCAAAGARRALLTDAASLAWPDSADTGWVHHLPPQTELRAWLPEVVGHARTLPLCTAVVIAGLAGYLERRRHGRRRSASILFNYRTSRRYGGRPDRFGSTVNHALHAWRAYGLVSEHRWPFAPELLDADPPASCLDEARAWRAPGFHRLDCGLPACRFYFFSLRTALAAGLPVAVEIPLHPSIVQSFDTGDIVLPQPDEPLVARHVVLLCGYDDTAGTFLFQNSWGTGWGDGGYGRLPYAMVRRGLVRDSWIVPGVRSPRLSHLEDEARAETDDHHARPSRLKAD